MKTQWLYAAALITACGTDDRGSADATGISTVASDTATTGDTATGGTSTSVGTGTGTTGADCVLDMDCDGGKVCKDGTCEIGSECGEEAFELEKVVPNVMIVLDRSGSMDGDVSGSTKNRWEVAKDAIFQVVTEFNEEIRFGLVTYSACIPLQECSAGNIEVPIGNLPAGPIMGFLADKGFFYLCNSGNPETSTGNTLAALISEPTLQDPMRTNAVLLITDGSENSECQTVTDAPKAAGALLAQPFPVKTYAVGFSDGIIGSLADVATAGGTVMPYNANDPQSLEDALGAIAGAVFSCTFELDTKPEDPSELYVFFNDDPVAIPEDPVNGWTYDEVANTITFHGTACDLLKNGAVADIDVVFGCDFPIPG